MSDRIFLVCGGTSEERRVSVASAQNLVRVCASAVPWFIAPSGEVHVCTPDALRSHERPFETDFVPARVADHQSFAAALDVAPRDAIFVLALHGGDGENGVVQRALAARGLAFTGSGSEASELAFDKTRAKDVVARAGVRVARASIVQGHDAEIERALLEAFRRSGRIVVKPVACGSSIGLYHVTSESSLASVARAVADARMPFLAEDFVQGVELTVGVVEAPGRPAEALPVSEIRLTGDGSFDYEGKYLGRGSIEITPAEVSPDVFAAAQHAALTAHLRVGCSGYSRTDVIASEGGVTFLEINTLPGLTRASFIPQQLDAAGRSIEQFLADQIALAKERRDRARA